MVRRVTTPPEKPQVAEPRGDATVEACWKEEERTLKELMITARCMRTVVRAVAALSKNPKKKMIVAVSHARDALLDALSAETAAFNRWHAVAQQPGLFDPAPEQKPENEARDTKH